MDLGQVERTLGGAPIDGRRAHGWAAFELGAALTGADPGTLLRLVAPMDEVLARFTDPGTWRTRPGSRAPPTAVRPRHRPGGSRCLWTTPATTAPRRRRILAQRAGVVLGAQNTRRIR
ncbi:hypothetical protein IAG44_38800 [Streptomyces roseirectus]|uniref:Uncharacterized protein n=1 Tax=Streptomyces roseirectus TaxID=2768066 RepID=A0A7H0IPV2_9ACTN|nr:hypothetical protein [Streptomyces roseirectus]QNP74818.1 hypothetical protein IAG44_38800 [Streptomyces roseirectus]